MWECKITICSHLFQLFTCISTLFGPWPRPRTQSGGKGPPRARPAAALGPRPKSRVQRCKQNMQTIWNTCEHCVIWHFDRFSYIFISHDFKRIFIFVFTCSIFVHIVPEWSQSWPVDELPSTNIALFLLPLLGYVFSFLIPFRCALPWLLVCLSFPVFAIALFHTYMFWIAG